MAIPNWSSLPSELINRIAGCFLATNDVDHYMDFRAVCTNWRSATDDPNNSSDVRFGPRLLVIIDEVRQSDARLLVNTATGRVIRKDLPLLRNYYVITTTHGGFFVLAGRKPSKAACVLNPFTGHMIRFMATVPPLMDFTIAVSGSSPTLFFFTFGLPTISMADPHSESLDESEENDMYHFIRLAVEGGICIDGEKGSFEPLSFPVAKILDVLKLYHIDPSTIFSHDDTGSRCFLVKCAGEVLIILQMQHHMVVLKMDTDTDRHVVEPVKTIGDQAIFMGDRRCLSVRADKFTSKANCIYFVKRGPGSSMDLYMYDLEEMREERISVAISYLEHIELCFADPPFTIIQLLSSCTVNVRQSPLFLENVSQYLKLLPAGGIPFDDLYDSDFEFDDMDM